MSLCELLRVRLRRRCRPSNVSIRCSSALPTRFASSRNESRSSPAFHANDSACSRPAFLPRTRPSSSASFCRLDSVLNHQHRRRPVAVASSSRSWWPILRPTNRLRNSSSRHPAAVRRSPGWRRTLSSNASPISVKVRPNILIIIIHHYHRFVLTCYYSFVSLLSPSRCRTPMPRT